MNKLAMSGYGYYVWSAYGFSCLILLVNIAGVIWQRRNVLKMLQQRFKKSQ